MDIGGSAGSDRSGGTAWMAGSSPAMRVFFERAPDAAVLYQQT
jgi:hypothetical protein